jgi:hypothetical protein
MLKHLSKIDEVEEQHKLNGFSHNKNFELKTRKELKEKEKLINPKQVFEKNPKNTKGKGSYRRSHVDDKTK